MSPISSSSKSVDWKSLEAAIQTLVKAKQCGPILVRLSWHDAGTYKQVDQTGGPRSCMRFSGPGEASHAANNGLQIARNLLSDIATKFTNVSTADLWAFAAIVAIQTMGGPKIPFRFGRSDAASSAESVDDGRLPDATQGADHIRDVFYRMGMDDEEIVALSGAHAVGRCHGDRSGFVGPWTESPLTFDNQYFKDLLEKKWVEQINEFGNKQFVHDKTETMMLPTDMALIQDKVFKPIVEKFAADKNTFFSAFSKAFQKLQESGVNSNVLTSVLY